MAIFQPDQASGWVQVALVIITIPVIFYQIHEIQEKIEGKPDIEIGVAAVKEYPLSNIYELPLLKEYVEVSQGYPFFMLVVRNNGKYAIKNFKIYLQYKTNSLPKMDSYSPRLIVSEFSENKRSFISENNVDFIFRSGSDFIVYPYSTETFGFYFTTNIIVDSERNEHAYPMSCICTIECSIWAEGLREPIIQELKIEIVKAKTISKDLEKYFP